MLAEMPLLTEAYQSKLVEIQQNSKQNQLKYLSMCNPSHLCEAGIGLRSDAEAADFIRRMQSSPTALKESKTKKRALSRTERRTMRQE
jgi:hypothetical protein